ncbi:MAG: AbrB/MazE/SpoVT family DNA-binding domain-containing protein [Candidatus Hydrogenedentes bacterium]|nr:AbrB/MazE/SpoVT family DNA-binding domain-containing protein [Candidatus Hydrogenedentota bacterium]
MKAVVAERGQITIPKPIRDRLGLTPGTLLDLREHNGKILAEKVPHNDPVAQVRGCLKLDKPTDELIDELRGHA